MTFKWDSSVTGEEVIWEGKLFKRREEWRLQLEEIQVGEQRLRRVMNVFFALLVLSMVMFLYLWLVGGDQAARMIAASYPFLIIAGGVVFFIVGYRSDERRTKHWKGTAAVLKVKISTIPDTVMVLSQSRGNPTLRWTLVDASKAAKVLESFYQLGETVTTLLEGKSTDVITFLNEWEGSTLRKEMAAGVNNPPAFIDEFCCQRLYREEYRLVLAKEWGFALKS